MPHLMPQHATTPPPQNWADMRSISPYPISGVSLSPFDTNYYLLRGRPFVTAYPLSEQLASELKPLSENCNVQGCGSPPADFCRTLRCPPLSIPTWEGCRK
uniref:Uncharacterized protein n=1 Tax=viral metagenome TaxID=1070528 RepID=A0A6C0BZ80_9ZZZZ